MNELLKKFYDAGVMHEATLNKKYSFEQTIADNAEALQLKQTGVSSRFDNVYTPPFRVGRKQGKAVLDSKGLQVTFMTTEKQAEMYCSYLNGY